MRTLATLHLADLFRDPKMVLPTKRDYQKIRRFLDGSWPEKVPPRYLITPENATDVVPALSLMEHNIAKWCVIDTEYRIDTKLMHTLGIGLRLNTPGHFVGVQVDGWPRLPQWVQDAVTDALKKLIGRMPTVFQNTLADVPVLEQNCGIAWKDYRAVEDTMLSHAVLWSEWPHSLEFLASLYGTHEKMKHLSTSDHLLYNWGDVCDTDAAWDALGRELVSDPRSEWIYRNLSLPLLPRLLRAKKTGIRIDRERVETAAKDLVEALQAAEWLAQAHVGWPINLGSVGGTGHVARYLYSETGLPVQFKRGARFRRDKKVTVDADAIASLRALVNPVPDFEAEERNGLNIESAIQRVSAGADPVLEARVVYAAAMQAESHYIRPAVVALERDGRFYPEFLIHAQANARWSTNNPPLAQLPDDLRDIVCPDPGTVWIGHDWDQIELRVNAFLSNDTPTLEAFEKKWDIHTLNACDLFGYPYPPDRTDPHKSAVNAEWRAALNWGGKDDTRRVFAKRFVYRMDYGGDAKNAGDIPGAQTLGFTGTVGANKLVQASQRYLAAHPAKAEWRQRTTTQALTTSEVRTLYGRRRRLLGDRNKKIRDAFDFPMQAFVSDWFNETFLLIAGDATDELKLRWFDVLGDLVNGLSGLEWMYGMHDSQWWQCQNDRVEETWPLYKLIVERPLTINGRTVVFPATFKRREL